MTMRLLLADKSIAGGLLGIPTRPGQTVLRALRNLLRFLPWSVGGS